ncbi:putative lipoprotein [Peteryoungia aggregata LMG 23059]|uniref:Lipoprotein n=1 Tax=Peteryoungia aggregata LMG 23059 TaxID=1368425 RepID=A0ABU0GBX8_9HYPH|nr:DUF2291 family protein [Peteryoungia aggregata]MDQ0422454.1 putative lipoprotein [Peteryoungia aggregata LMG 23059]
MLQMRAAAVFAALCVVMPGCKFVKTAEQEAQVAANAFDPDRMVAEAWDSKVLPYLQKRAGTFEAVTAMIASDPEAAAQTFGHKEKGGTAPWTYVATVKGVIVTAETKSRAAYVDVDINADGQSDLRLAIGPAIRGTALRDSLGFVSFNEFKNQIDWAQYGKSFNTYVNATVLEKLPRDGLVGKSVDALGAFPQPATGELPQFVPAMITVGG